MAHDVFISASSKDKAVADAVCATLEAHGLRCWIAPRDILPGQNWGEAIVEAIGASRAMVLVYSSHANTSPQVVREVERAVHKNVAIVPFRIEDVPMSKALEYFVSAPHWLDAFPTPAEAHFRQLAATVQRLLTRADAARGSGVPRGTAAAPGRTESVTGTAGRRRHVWTVVLLATLLGGAGATAWHFWPQVKRWVQVERAVPARSDAAPEQITGSAAPALPESRPSPFPEAQPEPAAPAEALAEVLPLKAQAELSWERVKALDRGQGFGDRLDEAESVLREAQGFFDHRVYGRAGARFTELRAICRRLADDHALRVKARAAVAAADSAASAARAAGGERGAPDLFSAAGRLLSTARAEWEGGDFKSALSNASAAVEQYAGSGKLAGQNAQVEKARKAYEQALRGYDAASLQRFGGEAWADVAAALGDAARPANGFNARIAAYQRAANLLPAADRAARAEQEHVRMRSKRSALLNEALDHPVEVELNTTVPKALEEITGKTGVPVELAPAAVDLLPWGEQTQIALKVSNQTLRQALRAIASAMGLVCVIGPESVRLEPLPALKRIGRRAAPEEIEALRLLASTTVNLDGWRPTLGELVKSIDRRLGEINSSFAVEFRPGPAATEALTVSVPRNATLVEALDAIVKDTPLAWGPSGRTILIKPKDEWPPAPR